MKFSVPNLFQRNSERPPAVSVVIPALNEEDSIGEVIAEVREFSPPGTEVLVVDNGSSDGTALLSEAAGVRVVNQLLRGKGNAMRLGAEKAAGDILVFIDGDGSYPPEAIRSLVEPVSRGEEDIVYGSRFLGSGVDGLPFWRIWGNRFLSRTASVLYGKTTDLLTGFFAIRKDRFRGLGLVSGGFEIEAEIFVKSRKSGCRIREVPIRFRRRGGVSKLKLWRDGTRIFRFLLRPGLR